MSNLKFSCDSYNNDDLTIHYRIEITPSEKGDIYYGIQLPSYVEQYSTTQFKVTRIKMKTPQTKIITGEIAFSEQTQLQSYYMKLIIVQNGGIQISRSFFNLIEPNKAKLI
ncbi:hypothetical protein MOO45_08080 (plasmid) [Bombilactobacillus folatiphilus]|uniref:Uncharacterized protein n=1 Tax=Bombilactobacillus folatiphilus TaxID=2923362 RepID=A0ABY4PB10_9LACO|nr:hypothetical protein [Bombilactobacillus folatiphilus]UQS81434.1 hypothetical protein MOO45_04185 [Bombilactobacillus folatiphilus]UQS82833.1 hypothetical protein MOO45_04110 [Bombilactobacillus folatiphilus]UQS82953.1 hypothetical protein MOO45_08080 [Bombilactobacillus folatiphilus]